MLSFLLAMIGFFLILRLATGSLPAFVFGKPVLGDQKTVRTNSDGSSAVEDAFAHALASCPEFATPLLEARAPCEMLLARAAAGDLDAMTLQIVERLRCHIPALVAAHCAVIEKAPPHLRRNAMAELVEDLRNMAVMARGRLDLLAAKRRHGSLHQAIWQ
ncbi:hypothetical protein [Croceicoccus mobilis]|uniref:Uncharacterized protein n=1 Tax=Croceicoccus mobilis TaxID=1703339 RepID=A0A917DZ31_9SPHN|nr:hypothetical protein [Croceicoccus mobilis]GGD81138.1 hypothetical protein GCM10010990_33880 [Croceicoccus mobilis]